MNTETSRQPQSCITPERFRSVLSHWPTGVSVVSTLDDDGAPVGVVIGSFSSVSLDPPLVAFALKKASSSLDIIRRHSAFSVNVLSREQAPLVDAFCAGGPRDRFRDVRYHLSDAGLPRIHDAVAWIDARLETEHEGGDHMILIGRVTALDEGSAGSPLVFSRGRLGSCEPMA